MISQISRSWKIIKIASIIIGTIFILPFSGHPINDSDGTMGESPFFDDDNRGNEVDSFFPDPVQTEVR